MSFGRGSIERPFYRKILELLPTGSTLLELGSGWTTKRLAKHYKVISIEHDTKYLTDNCIHAPLVNGWYDLAALQNLPPHDAILIDGPPAFNVQMAYSRMGFLVNLSLFNTSGILFFDDTERPGEFELAASVSRKLRRPVTFYPPKKPKQRKGFAVIS